MRKWIIYTVIVAVLLVSGAGCKKRLEDLYYNPDQTTQPSIEKFFTKMLDNNRVRPAYWELRTFVAMHTGIYSQSLAYLNNYMAYRQNPGYTQDRWSDFYIPGPNGGGAIVHYRSIESAFNELSPAQQEEEKIFAEAAKIALLDQASQMVDLWGDIPFSEAGHLNTSGEIIMAKFDNAVDVYRYITDNLEEAAAYFRNVQPSTTTRHVFSTQDILLNGDLHKWERYANSLRLRLLMRISFFDELRAKSEVMTMLANPSAYPLIDGEAEYSPQTTDVLLQPLTNYTDDLHNALTELNNYSAPQYLLDNVMKPAGDPRIPVMFDKYGRTVNDVFVPNADYNGLPVDMTPEQQQINMGAYSILDSATFLFNNKLPGIVITAPEVNFLKAEAFQRWGNGNAQTAYEMAVRQSVTFYYYLNGLNKTLRTPLPVPSQQEVDNFIQQPSIKYGGTSEEKLSRIWIQKWVHFGFLQSVQSWSEYRRTKYPQLNFFPSTLPGFELPPSRLTYPSTETSYNFNYQFVKERDNRDVKIFWDVK